MRGDHHERKALSDEPAAVAPRGPAIAPTSIAPGAKHDDGKPRWDLLPHHAVAQVVAVLSFGAKKYQPDNWRAVQGWRWRYYAAAWRHAVAWWLGERHDPESGLHHLAHAACCMLFLLELDVTDGGGK